jgi:hypothetical protein
MESLVRQMLQAVGECFREIPLCRKRNVRAEGHWETEFGSDRQGLGEGSAHGQLSSGGTPRLGWAESGLRDWATPSRSSTN